MSTYGALEIGYIRAIDFLARKAIAVLVIEMKKLPQGYISVLRLKSSTCEYSTSSLNNKF